MNTKKINKRLITMSKIIVIGLLLTTGSIYIARKVGYARVDNNMPIHSVDTNDKKISLTFDIGWENPDLEKLLVVLEKYNVKSTFFMPGIWAEDNKEMVELIYSKGHEIGNNSNTHIDLTSISEESAKEEIELADEILEKTTDLDVNLYRPPYGVINDEIMDICDENGYKVIKWDIDSLDWKEIGHNYVVDRVTRNIQPGSIVLLHTSTKGIDKYVEDILINLETKEYESVPVNELIHKENYIVDSNGVQIAN